MPHIELLKNPLVPLRLKLKIQTARVLVFIALSSIMPGPHLVSAARGASLDESQQIKVLCLKRDSKSTALEAYSPRALLQSENPQAAAFVSAPDLKSMALTLRSNRTLLMRANPSREDFRKIYWLMASGSGIDLMCIDSELSRGRWVFFSGPADKPNVLAIEPGVKANWGAILEALLLKRGFSAVALPTSGPFLDVLSPRGAELTQGIMGVVFDKDHKGTANAQALIEVTEPGRDLVRASIVAREQTSALASKGPLPVLFESPESLRKRSP